MGSIGGAYVLGVNCWAQLSKNSACNTQNPPSRLGLTNSQAPSHNMHVSPFIRNAPPPPLSRHVKQFNAHDDTKSCLPTPTVP